MTKPEFAAEGVTEQIDDAAREPYWPDGEAMSIEEAITFYALVSTHCEMMVDALNVDLRREQNDAKVQA